MWSSARQVYREEEEGSLDENVMILKDFGGNI